MGIRWADDAVAELHRRYARPEDGGRLAEGLGALLKPWLGPSGRLFRWVFKPDGGSSARWTLEAVEGRQQPCR